MYKILGAAVAAVGLGTGIAYAQGGIAVIDLAFSGKLSNEFHVERQHDPGAVNQHYQLRDKGVPFKTTDGYCFMTGFSYREDFDPTGAYIGGYGDISVGGGGDWTVNVRSNVAYAAVKGRCLKY